MSFLIVLAAIVIEFTVSSFAAFRSSGWSLDWARWCNAVGRGRSWWQGYPAALVIVLLPMLATAFTFSVLAGWSSGLAAVTSLGVLLLLLGPDDLGEQLLAYKDTLMSSAVVQPRPPDFVLAARGIDLGVPTGDAEFDRDRVELAALALAAERGWYQPLAWFFVGGPVLAVGYRLAANLRQFDELEPPTLRAVQQILAAMEYVPARVTAFALGVAGTLTPVVERVREIGVVGWGVSGELVAGAALAATDYGRIREVITGDARIYRLNQMFELLKRAVVVWLVVLAVLSVLIG